jgi:tetratricopeptide (TPR) repeat protein
MSRLALACSVLAIAGCAARGPSPQVLAELGKADTLLRQGCYTCLKEAESIYVRLASAPKAPPAAAQGAFDAALLIAIREGELGISVPPSLDVARTRAAAVLPPAPPRKGKPAAPPAIAPSRLLDAAALYTGETSGLDPEQRGKVTGRARPPVNADSPQRRALDESFDTNLVAAYVALAIDCEQTALREKVDVKSLMQKFTAVPLMQFRLGVCGGPGGPQAHVLREANPRFTDTLPWEARVAMVGSQRVPIDLYRAAALLGEAHQAFPRSWSIAMLWSRTNQAIAEFEASLVGYDAVLAAAPTHRDAMLGRVTGLSYLLRHTDAIAWATKLIELGTWHIGDAHYWRAWNHYNLKAYEPAWADVEVATKLLSNSSVYMLAGLIAYARTDLPTAILRFDRAFVLDPNNCDAVWMSGLVNVDRQEWEPASPKFSRGMTCFTRAAANARADLKDLEAGIALRGGPADPPTAQDQRNDKQRAKLIRDAEIADERAAQSAFNAAQGYARSGQKQLALNHADAATAHPKMKEKAEALKAAIEKLP